MNIDLLPFDENQIRNLLQKAGYSFSPNLENQNWAFIKRLGGDWYPRFHIYLNSIKTSGLQLNIHLDQKRPSYGNGTHAHSGEYEGELVEKEVKRIKNFFEQELINRKIMETKKDEKTGFLKKLFKF